MHTKFVVCPGRFSVHAFCAVLCCTSVGGFSLLSGRTGGQEGATRLRPPLPDDFYSESLLDKVSGAGIQSSPRRPGQPTAFFLLPCKVVLRFF